MSEVSAPAQWMRPTGAASAWPYWVHTPAPRRLLVFDFAVLARNGFHGFSLNVFKPSVVFAGGFGLWS
jgi:hypothetical protein